MPFWDSLVFLLLCAVQLSCSSSHASRSMHLPHHRECLSQARPHACLTTPMPSSQLPRHPDAFLMVSSPPPRNSSPAATVPRDAFLYLLLISSLLLSSSLNIIPSIGKASSTCILSTPSQPTSNQPPTPNFPSSASHTADMKSNYNMLAMAAAAAQANAMPSQQLW
jgi:hypothetical protein